MKKIFYSLMTLALFTACSNDDILPDVPKEGPVQLASVSVGVHTRGTIDNGEFAFDNEDKVVMTATVNSSQVSNTFTYHGGKWSQDAPEGNYSLICIQDNPMIESIVSYGGKVERGVYTDQSSMESYAMASSLAADPMRYLGDISITDNLVAARLDHDNSDLALKVYDGYDEKNTLLENTPVLKVIVDEDGSGSDSKLLTFTAWNAGKSTDSDGTYTLFRVQLPAGCSILEAELSNVNETAGGLKTDIHFRESDGQPSNEIDLEAGRRYSASYTYDMLKTVATVNVSISPFEGGDLDQDIIASRDWSFDATTKTYTVFTAEGLQIVNRDITNNIAKKGDYNITLAADIELPDPVAPETSNWTPLGDSSNPYIGTFDGAGHTISNLQINSTADNAGLIGVGNGCVVKCLILANPEINGGNNVGGIIGTLYSGRIIACGVNEANITATGSCLGGIVGFWDATGLSQSPGYMYSCYAKDCTKGTDLQAIEGNANLIGGISVRESNTATMYNCAYRTKGSGITYGVGGSETGPTDNDYTVDMFITLTGWTSTDWSIVASNLNEGIRNWNEFEPTLPSNWEWDATEEGKLKVKQ